MTGFPDEAPAALIAEIDGYFTFDVDYDSVGIEAIARSTAPDDTIAALRRLRHELGLT